jgi:predicted amidohydrolase
MALAAVAQMNASSVVDSNLASFTTFFKVAKDSGASLLLLPENCAFMGKQDGTILSIGEDFDHGHIQNIISKLAKKYGLWVIAGTIPLKGVGHRVRSSSLVFDNAGKCVARYDKIHLFDVRISAEESYQESLNFEPGDKLVVVDTPIGRVGLSVCYDLRFPELYRQLVLQGAEILAIPSAFTAKTGAAHWRVLCRARAIENLCYVLAANQCGEHDNGRSTYGHSLIIEPWGNILAEQESGAGVIVAEIDLQHLKQLRREFPCNEHHRLMTEYR